MDIGVERPDRPIQLNPTRTSVAHDVHQFSSDEALASIERVEGRRGQSPERIRILVAERSEEGMDCLLDLAFVLE